MSSLFHPHHIMYHPDAVRDFCELPHDMKKPDPFNNFPMFTILPF